MNAPLIASVFLLVATLVAASAAAQDGANEPAHPSLRLSEGVQLELLARVQIDGRHDQLDIARKRIGTRGRVGRVLAFELEAEVEADSPWRDAYVEYRQWRALRVRGGRFKLPFSLEQTTSSANLDFIDRSAAADRLSLGRSRSRAALAPRSVDGHDRVHASVREPARSGSRR